MRDMTAEDKANLRKKFRALRDGIPSETRHKKSLAVQKKFLSLDEYKACASVLVYWAFRSETETFLIAETALRDGKTVALPFMQGGGEMLFIKITSLGGLVKNSFGIYEPEYEENNIFTPDENTTAVVPGLAFSEDGRRLGYGGGYYDRYFCRRKIRAGIGLCFSEQLCDSIPTDENDIIVDRVIFA